MGLLNNLFGNSGSLAEKKLATGEINWRLKPEILATKNFPNFLKFISKIESENNIQFGVHNDVSDEIQKTLILRQVIYNLQGAPVFTFCIFFQFIPMIGEISFLGNITNFFKPEELMNPKKEYTVSIMTKKANDLELDEYEKYYWELLNNSLSIYGLDPNEYSIKGKQCVYKIMEQNVREKYK